MIDMGLKYPFFASPGIKGKYFFVKDGVVFGDGVVDINYQIRFGITEYNNMHFVVAEFDDAYVFDINAIEGFAFRFQKLRAIINHRSKGDHKLVEIELRKNRFGPSIIESWRPRAAGMCVLEHRIIRNDVELGKYKEIAKEQGYSKIYARNTSSSILDIVQFIML